MKIRLWGVRGSIPTTGPETEYYGGNTSCVAVWHDDSLLVLDGGQRDSYLGSTERFPVFVFTAEPISFSASFSGAAA